MSNQPTSKRELCLVTWEDVRSEVSKTNQELAKLIDSINPGKKFKFIKASYLFGDLFVKSGEAQLPIDNNLIPLSDPSIDSKIKNELSYNLMPLMFLLQKNSEFFVNAGERIIPVNLFHKGDLTGTYEAMDYMNGRKSSSVWSLSAGSRSTFMLPKITDKTGLKKLRTIYNISSSVQIEKPSDHWALFKNIAQSENFSQTWQCPVLFFGQKWLDPHDSKEWSDFRNYLNRTIWEQANYAIDKIRFNMAWESCARIISFRRLQAKAYLVDHVKHLLSVVAGNFPAFAVMDDSQESAPTEELQKVFVDQYDLKQYLPTLMQACMLWDKVANPNYVYYSLAIPTILEGSPLKKTTSTILNDLREIKLIIEALKQGHSSINLDLETSKIIQNIEADYFHYENDMYHQIKPSSEIPTEDTTFIKDQKNFPTRSFCPTSPVFSGCIRLAKKNN